MNYLYEIFAVSIALVFAFSVSGCAVHHFDEDAGVEHVWGFGHMQMKVQEPNEGVQSVVSGVESFGAAVGNTRNGGFVSLGWLRNSSINIIDEDAQFRLDWPSNDFFSVRVGSDLPVATDITAEPSINLKK